MSQLFAPCINLHFLTPPPYLCLSILSYPSLNLSFPCVSLHCLSLVLTFLFPICLTLFLLGGFLQWLAPSFSLTLSFTSVFSVTCPFFPFLYNVLPVGSAVYLKWSLTYDSPLSFYNVLPFSPLSFYNFFHYRYISLQCLDLSFTSLFLQYLALSLSSKSLQHPTCRLCRFCEVISAIRLPTLQAAISLDHGSLSDSPPSRWQLRGNSVGSPGKRTELNFTTV